MKTELKRHEFITRCFKAGATGCALLYGNSILAFNVDFDPARVFCYGCKPKDKPLSINVNACTVRKCAIEKGIDCCIECTGLTACEKELWKNYP